MLELKSAEINKKNEKENINWMKNPPIFSIYMYLHTFTSLHYIWPVIHICTSVHTK